VDKWSIGFIIMSRIWMSHVTHTNDSRHTYKLFMSHILMSHVTHRTRSDAHIHLANLWYVSYMCGSVGVCACVTIWVRACTRAHSVVAKNVKHALICAHYAHEYTYKFMSEFTYVFMHENIKRLHEYTWVYVCIHTRICQIYSYSRARDCYGGVLLPVSPPSPSLPLSLYPAKKQT